MSLDKAKLKALIATEYGSSIEDLKEQSEIEAYRSEGREAAFAQVAKMIHELAKRADEDLEKGELSLSSVKSDVDLAKLVKRWILRAAGVAENLGELARASRLAMGGRTEGLKLAMRVLEKSRDEELAKAAGIERAAADGPPDAADGRPTGVDRPTGVHPGSGLAAARKAERGGGKRRRRRGAGGAPDA